MDIRLRFAQNLRECLKASGKIQDDIIRDLGVSSSIVSQWCTGKTMPRPSRVERLAKYLGVSVDVLYSGDIEVPIHVNEEFDTCDIIKNLKDAGVREITLRF